MADLIWTNAFFDDARSLAVAIRIDARCQGRDLTDDDIEAVKRPALERAELLKRVKASLEAHDQKQAIKLMCEYCGLEPAQWATD